MSKIKTDLGVSGLTQVQLDRIADQHNGVIGVIAPDSNYVPDESINRKVLPGGWMAIWVGDGRLVLKATTPRTHALLKRGTIAKWVEFGLRVDYAERLWELKVSQKFRLAEILGQILNDPDLLVIWCQHPKEYGKGTGRAAWIKLYGERLPEILNAPFETVVAKTLITVLGGIEE